MVHPPGDYLWGEDMDLLPNFSSYYPPPPSPTHSIQPHLSHMEGLIPFVYRVILQFRAARQSPMAETWLDGSPPNPYVRLPEDSGPFKQPEIKLFRFFGSSSSTSPLVVSTGTQSHLLSR